MCADAGMTGGREGFSSRRGARPDNSALGRMPTVLLLMLTLLFAKPPPVLGTAQQSNNATENVSGSNSSNNSTPNSTSQSNMSRNASKEPSQPPPDASVPPGCQKIRTLSTGMGYGLCIPLDEQGDVAANFNKKLAVIVLPHYFNDFDGTPVRGANADLGYHIEARQTLFDGHSDGEPLSLREMLMARGWGTAVVTFDDPPGSSTSWLAAGAGSYLQDIVDVRAAYETTFRNFLGEPCHQSALKSVVVVGVGLFGGVFAVQIAERFGDRIDAAVAISSPVGPARWTSDYFGDALSLATVYFPDTFQSIVDVHTTLSPNSGVVGGPLDSAFLQEDDLTAGGTGRRDSGDSGNDDGGDYGTSKTLQYRYLDEDEGSPYVEQREGSAAESSEGDGVSGSFFESLQDHLGYGSRGRTSAAAAAARQGGPPSCRNTCFGGQGFNDNGDADDDASNVVWNRREQHCAALLSTAVCCAFPSCRNCSACAEITNNHHARRRTARAKHISFKETRHATDLRAPHPDSPLPPSPQHQSAPLPSPLPARMTSSSPSLTVSAPPPPPRQPLLTPFLSPSPMPFNLHRILPPPPASGENVAQRVEGEGEVIRTAHLREGIEAVTEASTSAIQVGASATTAAAIASAADDHNGTIAPVGNDNITEATTVTNNLSAPVAPFVDVTRDEDKRVASSFDDDITAAAAAATASPSWNCNDLLDYYQSYFLQLTTCQELVWALSKSELTPSLEAGKIQAVCTSACFDDFAAWSATFESMGCAAHQLLIVPRTDPSAWARRCASQGGAQSGSFIEMGSNTGDAQESGASSMLPKSGTNANEKRFAPINFYDAELGELNIDFVTSMPWTRYIMSWSSFVDGLARDAAARGPEALRGFLVSLGKSKSTESLPPHALTADGKVSAAELRRTLIPMLIAAAEYEATFQLAVTDWAYGNTKTFYPGRLHGKEVNGMVARRVGSPGATNLENILFSTSGRPEKPVLLLCSDHDLTVPAFHCLKYAREASGHKGNTSNTSSLVEVLHGTQAQHLRFTHDELSTALDRAADLAAESHAAAVGGTSGVARPWLDIPGSAALSPSHDGADSAVHLPHIATQRWQDILQGQARRLRDREVNTR